MTTQANESLSFGLWSKVSKNGLKYLSGKLELDGKVYWMSVFNNTKKTEDRHPTCNLVLNLAEDQPVKQEEPLAAIDGGETRFAGNAATTAAAAAPAQPRE